MKIILSLRDKEETKEYNSEEKLKFPKEFNATMLAKELYYLGYKDEKSILEQLKERDFEMNDDAKKAIKGVLECIKQREETGFKQ